MSPTLLSSSVRDTKSLATACITIPSVVAFGKFLDVQRWSQRHRAWGALLLWSIPQIACFIWINIMNHQLGPESTLDYELYVPLFLTFT